VPAWIRAGLDRLVAERRVALSDVANEAFTAYLRRQGIRPSEKAKAGR
jgi:hypothetical protein